MGVRWTDRLMTPHFAELPDDALVRAEDVARFVGCSPRTIWRAKIPSLEVTPRVHRFRVGDVRTWIAAHVAVREHKKPSPSTGLPVPCARESRGAGGG